MSTEPVRSPCVKLCVLDAGNVCEGCGRSLDEIAGWTVADEAARRAILARAAKRLAAKAARA